MSILSIASNASVWRGYEYYEGKRILSWKQTGEHGFEESKVFRLSVTITDYWEPYFFAFQK